MLQSILNAVTSLQADMSICNTRICELENTICPESVNPQAETQISVEKDEDTLSILAGNESSLDFVPHDNSAHTPPEPAIRPPEQAIQPPEMTNKSNIQPNSWDLNAESEESISQQQKANVGHIPEMYPACTTSKSPS